MKHLYKRQESKDISQMFLIVLSDFFYVDKTVLFKKVSEGIRYDWIFLVLTRDDLTMAQKRKYVYGLSISDELKDNIWERFIGDKTFKYCKDKNQNTEVEI